MLTAIILMCVVAGSVLSMPVIATKRRVFGAL
jgi:hypothetical protein